MFAHCSIGFPHNPHIAHKYNFLKADPYSFYCMLSGFQAPSGRELDGVVSCLQFEEKTRLIHAHLSDIVSRKGKVARGILVPLTIFNFSLSTRCGEDRAVTLIYTVVIDLAILEELPGFGLIKSEGGIEISSDEGGSIPSKCCIRLEFHQLSCSPVVQVFLHVNPISEGTTDQQQGLGSIAHIVDDLDLVSTKSI